MYTVSILDIFRRAVGLHYFVLIFSDQMQYSNLIGQRADDVQVVFGPSLEHCSIEHFKLDNGKIVWAAFQILVKPGAYSLSRDIPEWSTKETGALTLQALLLKIH